MRCLMKGVIMYKDIKKALCLILITVFVFASVVFVLPQTNYVTYANAALSSSKSVTVYYTPSGKKYHKSKKCRTLKRSKKIYKKKIKLSKIKKSKKCKVCWH